MRVLPTVALLVFLAGCGGSEPQEPAATAAAATSTATPEATATPNPQTEIRALVSDYYTTVSGNDPEGTCELLTPADRKHFDRKAGRCARALKFSAKTRKAVKGNRAGTIKLDGDRARIVVTDYASGELDEPHFAVKVDGKWWMARKVTYSRAG